MSNLIDEVNDDIRRQQLATFWRENGPWIIGGVVLAIVLTAGMTFYRSHQTRVNTEQTQQLLDALETQKLEAIAAFGAQGRPSHAVYGLLAEANLRAQNNDRAGALTIYREIENTSGIDGTWRELAQLLSIAHRLDTDPADVLHRELAALSRRSVWRFSARELTAYLYAREKKMQEAADTLKALAEDRNAPEDLRMRAGTLFEFYQGAARG